MAKLAKPNAILASADPILTRYLTAIFESLEYDLLAVADAETIIAEVERNRTAEVILLDERLPGIQRGDLLAALQETWTRASARLVLLSEFVQDRTASLCWLQRLQEGVLDDIVPHSATWEQWSARLLALRRTRGLADELEQMREAALHQVQYDRLTGTLNRDAMLTALFRETDRVQRMSGSLCLVMLDIDDFGHWNAELGNLVCDELLNQVSRRIERLMRSYDLLGRIGKDEFLLALPGCSMVNAVILAERLRSEIFAEPFAVQSEQIRLSACFGITSSRGRSPVVALREVEQVLAAARMNGPDTIRTAREASSATPADLIAAGPYPGSSLAY